MPKRLVNPVPEMLKGDKWEVRESKDPSIAYVDLAAKQMVVPLDESVKSEMLRSHELMHVAITPYDREFKMDAAVEERTLQSVEDCRVWTELKRVGINPQDVDVAEDEKKHLPLMRMALEMKGFDEDSIQLEMARLLIARHNTGSEGWMRDLAESQDYDRAIKAADEVLKNHFEPYERRKEQVPFDEVIKACEDLHAFFEPKPSPEEEEGSGDGEGEKDGEGEMQPGEGYSAPSGDTEAKPEEQEGEESKEEKPQQTRKPSMEPVVPEGKKVEKIPRNSLSEKELEEADEAGINGSYTAGGSPTGEMRMWTPQLTQAYRPSKGRKKVSTDIGVNPAAIHRATVDQKVFKEKQIRDYGVAILIDCSGSMSIPASTIEEILNECPAATVALYGSEGTKYSNNSGVLKVVVSRKLRLDTRDGGNIREGIGGGNVVDLPAVEWLAKRREEIKIWVCDGMVTGKGDNYLNAEGTRRITRLVLDKGIKRVGSPRELLTKKTQLFRKGS